MTDRRNTTFIINGGAGRVICSIPALEQYRANNPNDDFKVIVYGWENLFWNHPMLQSRVFSVSQKGLFDMVIKNSIVKCPEPYHDHWYYNQECSLRDAFMNYINPNEVSMLDVSGCLHLHSNEIKSARKLISDAKQKNNKSKFIVFQPYGSGMQFINDEPVDLTNRSFTVESAMNLATQLSEDAVILFFGDDKFIHPRDNVMINTRDMSDIDLRFWMAIISECDYFVGCDSVGQHIARAFNKNGLIAMGASCEINVTYPEWFTIFRKQDRTPTFTPLRLSDTDVGFANRLNDDIMNFTTEEVNEISSQIKRELSL